MLLRRQEPRTQAHCHLAPGSCLRRSTGSILGALLLLIASQPARAQLSAEAALTSDYRLRGYSLSHREPAASLTLGYDDASGLFVDGTAVLLRMPGGKIGFMGGFATIGYAKRLSSDLSLDAGLLRAQFTRQSSYRRNASYTELFAGLTGRSFAVRAALSPDYLWDRTTTLYVSGELVRRPWPKWRVVAHAGLLATLSGGPPYPASETQYDWSLRVGRQLGKADLELAWSNGGPNREMFDGRWHPKSALTGTARWAF
ncbi:MAG: hypothetical protein J7494_14125 [Sphingobium sp.]|nr:hypothetical protein [Sphingobium sp.]